MKKQMILAAILCGILAISLAGCGKQNPPLAKHDNEVPVSEMADDTSGDNTGDAVPAAKDKTQEVEAQPTSPSKTESAQTVEEKRKDEAPVKSEKPRQIPASAADASDQTEVPPAQPPKAEESKPMEPSHTEPAEPSQPEPSQPESAESQQPEPQQPEPAEPSQPEQAEPQQPEPPKEPEPEQPKSAYDYGFDMEAIRSDLIALGEGMGLTHITTDNGTTVTPDNASWATPVTASGDFQGDRLKRKLGDYVQSMPGLITAYGGEPIEYFTIYIEPLGGGSYRIYFLY